MCLGYFGPRRFELRMPKSDAAGEVLSGKTSVEMALYLSAIRALKDWSLEFARPEDYDPVLRAHCRFDREG